MERRSLISRSQKLDLNRTLRFLNTVHIYLYKFYFYIIVI